MRSWVFLVMLAVMCALFTSQANARGLRRLQGGMRLTQDSDKYLWDNIINAAPTKDIDKTKVKGYMDLLWEQLISSKTAVSDVKKGKKEFFDKLYYACTKVREIRKNKGLFQFEEAVEGWAKSMETQVYKAWISKPYADAITAQAFRPGVDPLKDTPSDLTKLVADIKKHVTAAFNLFSTYKTFVESLPNVKNVNCATKISDLNELNGGPGYFRILQKFVFGMDSSERLSRILETKELPEFYKKGTQILEQMVTKKAFQIKDLLRAKVEIKDSNFVNEFKAIYDKIGSKAILEVKNNLKYSIEIPYPSVFIIFEFHGVPVELQIVPEGGGDDVAIKKSHTLYEINRSAPNIGLFGMLNNVDMFLF